MFLSRKSISHIRVVQSQIVVATLVPPVTPRFARFALGNGTTPKRQGAKRSYLFEADNYDISLIVQTNPDDTRRLSGQVLSTNPGQTTTFELIPLRLSEPPIQGDIDRVGSFSVPSLAVGEHRLVLEMASTIIVIPVVTIT